MADKKALRLTVKKLVKALSPGLKAKQSASVAQQVRALTLLDVSLLLLSLKSRLCGRSSAHCGLCTEVARAEQRFAVCGCNQPPEAQHYRWLINGKI